MISQVVALETMVHGGTQKVEEKELAVLTELLMIQLLKLDTIEADGVAKVQRRIEVSSSRQLCLLDQTFMLLRYVQF